MGEDSWKAIMSINSPSLPLVDWKSHCTSSFYFTSQNNDIPLGSSSRSFFSASHIEFQVKSLAFREVFATEPHCETFGFWPRRVAWHFFCRQQIKNVQGTVPVDIVLLESNQSVFNIDQYCSMVSRFGTWMNMLMNMEIITVPILSGDEDVLFD